MEKEVPLSIAIKKEESPKRETEIEKII